MSSTFDHLDHIANDLIARGVIPKTMGQVFHHTFKGGTDRWWAIDKMRDLVAALPNRSSFLREISVGDVQYIDELNQRNHNLDREYALSIPHAKKFDPAFVVTVTPDLGTPPEFVGQSMVVDGNHRIHRAAIEGRSMNVIMIPPEIERACRLEAP